ncbi:low temperature requirement protein A [Agromyces protaetiae]|uniref:Low temperature requirement protein A n=1 Tax=Agromyces protaetiae TaxID=2509455 RepID=A0A4P6FJ66_9MICO|nr:low temperature requirement protein A [Agromyces protaetiae]QAY74017.1 low temperature requirement protein A [Agromyces protaetiae]
MARGIRPTSTSRLLAVGVSRDGDRVTTLELFFDLVYVFAFHQVSEIILDEPSAAGLLRGLVTLALVWWSWTAYAWLANQARADDGVVRLGMVLATAVMFLVALAIPEAWDDLPGGLSGPLVFVIGYLLVRVVHGTVYLIAAGSDAGLRRQVLVSMATGLVPAAALLVAGCLVGGALQVWLWAVAIAIDWLLVYLTSRAGNSWRLNSASHFSERHGLIVILALGESIIAIGAVAMRIPVDWEVLGAALAAVALALGLWWSYFHHLADKVEHELAVRAGSERAALAVDVYTYLHYPIVAAIVLVAVGIDEAMLGIGEERPLEGFAAGCLGAGLAIYLAATVLIWRRASGEWTLPRSIGALAAVALIPAFAALPSIASLAIAAVFLAALLAIEQALHGRAAVRPGP